MAADKNDVHSVAPEVAIEFFSEVMPFNTLDQEALTKLARHCRIDFFPKGTQVFKTGETDVKDLYIIQSGGVKTFIVDDDGKLIGIFTDGDLRRIMSTNHNLMTLKAKEVVHRDSKKIKADDLAATAIAVMEEHSITSLIITDDLNKPLGIIHLHDILKAKVV